jgi:hypothetical protein
MTIEALCRANSGLPRKRTQSHRVDGSELARPFFTFAGWSVQPCVRPVYAVHMTAGHNALRGSGPGQTPAFEMHWHKWVVLIAGSTGSALRAVGPPNLHITPDVGAISLRRECDGFLIALTPGHHGPRHPGDLVGKRDRRDLGRPPCQQC